MDISSNPAITSSAQPLEANKVQKTDHESLESLVKVNRGEAKYTQAEWEPYSRLAGESQLGWSEKSHIMRAMYTGFQNAMLEESPELLEKDWDFSVDEAGELVIIEGKDTLSSSEINQLTDTLEKFGMKDAMNALSDDVINWGVGMRGPEEIADQGGLERYDVNKENFKDIIFGRELMLNMKIKSDTKLTAGQTMQYALKSGGIGGSEREHQARARYEYNQTKQHAPELIAAQIMMRAEARY